MDYSPTRPRSLQLDAVAEMRSALISTTLNGFSVREKKVHFVYFDTKDAQLLSELGQTVSCNFRNDPQTLHVTISAGKHAPAEIASAAKQYHADPPIFILPDLKTGELIIYKYPKETPVKVHVLDLIYI